VEAVLLDERVSRHWLQVASVEAGPPDPGRSPLLVDTAKPMERRAGVLLGRLALGAA
jgi:hypothetical protein